MAQYQDRIRLKDIEESIYRPSPVKEKSDNHIPVMYFTFKGKEDELSTLDGELNSDGYPVLVSEEKSTCAKRTFYPSEERYHYYIKRDAKGKLLNPIDMYEEGKQGRVVHGLDTVKFREVNKAAFTHYINFLKTRNVSHLRNAERETI